MKKSLLFLPMAIYAATLPVESATNYLARGHNSFRLENTQHIEAGDERTPVSLNYSGKFDTLLKQDFKGMPASVYKITLELQCDFEQSVKSNPIPFGKPSELMIDVFSSAILATVFIDGDEVGWTNVCVDSMYSWTKNPLTEYHRSQKQEMASVTIYTKKLKSGKHMFEVASEWQSSQLKDLTGYAQAL